MPETIKIPIASLVEPEEPMRLELDEQELDKLASSLKANGQLFPLLVMREYSTPTEAPPEVDAYAWRPAPEPTGRYRIRDGHRRYLAARSIGLRELECKVFEPGEANEVVLMAQANLMRHGLTDFELGNYYATLADLPGMTERQLQDLTGETMQHIYTRIELVKADPEVALAVHHHGLALSVAKVLNQCPDEGQRRYWLRMAVDGGANTRTVKGWLWDWQKTQGIRQEPPQIVGTQPPPGPIIASNLCCILCGQSHRPYDLANVYICNNELALLKSTLKGEGA
jgi:hypothetical protein